jgi:myo-inositol-1-phosphate synthase
LRPVAIFPAIYAAIKTGVPFANGAPNLTCDIPALLELGPGKQIPPPLVAKILKPGKTPMKTIWHRAYMQGIG